MRPTLLFPLLLLILSGIPSSGPDARARLRLPPQMAAKQIPLDAGNPGRRKIDALTYLGGVRLSSRDPAFGGFSAMIVRDDAFTLVGDGGGIVRFRMTPQWQVSELQFGDMRDGPGSGWAKGDRDVESLASDPATGTIWIGYESGNAIWRYDADLAHAQAHVAPPPMRRWDVNGGGEAMVRLTDGSFVLLSETSDLPGIPGNAALRFSGDPTDPVTRSFAFAFRPPEGGFNASDMAQLPDGRLLVLARRISITGWFESKLVLLDPTEIRPNASIAGTVIATLTGAVTRDNFEALAVTREGGATILWIASDDNRQPVQQSLLMKFRLDLPAELKRN